jgi:hypothetical protein
MQGPLTATDVYMRHFLLFPQRIQNMSFIFIVLLRTWKQIHAYMFVQLAARQAIQSCQISPINLQP